MSCEKPVTGYDTFDGRKTFQKEIIKFYDDILVNEEHEEICLLDATFSNPSAGFKCEMCDFMAKSEGGLKIHNKKKHKQKK